MDPLEPRTGEPVVTGIAPARARRRVAPASTNERACALCGEPIGGPAVEARGTSYCSSLCAHAHGLKLAESRR